MHNCHSARKEAQQRSNILIPVAQRVNQRQILESICIVISPQTSSLFGPRAPAGEISPRHGFSRFAISLGVFQFCFSTPVPWHCPWRHPVAVLDRRNLRWPTEGGIDAGVIGLSDDRCSTASGSAPRTLLSRFWPGQGSRSRLCRRDRFSTASTEARTRLRELILRLEAGTLPDALTAVVLAATRTQTGRHSGRLPSHVRSRRPNRLRMIRAGAKVPRTRPI